MPSIFFAAIAFLVVEKAFLAFQEPATAIFCLGVVIDRVWLRRSDPAEI